jgi:outer membrane protein insertion porin family
LAARTRADFAARTPADLAAGTRANLAARARAGLAACLIACFVASSAALAPAHAEDPAIVITGNRHVDAEVIKSRFQLKKNNAEPGAEDLDGAVKALYSTHLFSNVKIWRSGSTIHVEVTENPVIARLALEGNKAVKDKDLKPLLKSKEGEPLSTALIHDDIELMLELYHRRGRFNAHIVPKTIETKDRGVSLVYEISEGERTGIRSITFLGNHAFAADRLRSVIKTGQTNVLSVLLDNDFYDPDKVETDRDLLSRFYRAHGYADVRIVSARPEYDNRKKLLALTFTIEEGPRYSLGTVAVKSDVPGVPADEMGPLLETSAGNLYNADAIDRSAETILAKLAGRGEPFVNVRPEFERIPDRQKINLVYRLEPGARAYVERIEIHGNRKTRDSVIRREIGLVEGAPYNRALVKLSERRLKKLGFFKSVKFDQRNGSAPDRVILDLTVEEQDTGEFTIAGGYSDVDGFVANVSVGDRNLFGRGESAKVSVEYGQYVKGFDVGFSEPYLFGQKVALGLNLFAQQRDANSNQSYTSTVFGGRVGLGAPITDQFGMNLHYGLTRQSLVLDPALGVASIPVQQAAAAGPQWVSTVGTTATYNTLDDDRHPTSGLSTSATNDVAGFGGDVKFLRNTDDLRYYQPLGEYVTSLTRAQTGYITPWGGQTLPLLNGFFGGPTLVRGFAPNGFGPRAITPGTTMDNLGGNVYWATSQELQAPLPFVPSEFALKGAVFADAGSLWRTSAAGFGPALSQSLQVNNSHAIRSAMGAGLIWDSILGPLRVDYAYPLTKGPYDITQRLHFGFGMF